MLDIIAVSIILAIDRLYWRCYAIFCHRCHQKLSVCHRRVPNLQAVSGVRLPLFTRAIRP